MRRMVPAVLVLSLLTSCALLKPKESPASKIINWEYVTTNNTVTISSGGMERYSLIPIVIPDKIDGLPVTSIDDYAFEDCRFPTRVTIPASVTNIGKGAFTGCRNLTAIDVDTNNPAYCSDNGVLFNKEKTRLIQYPAGRRGSYKIPEGVRSIEWAAFADASHVTRVTIPGSVTNIEDAAFVSCPRLVRINIPDGVRSIGRIAFYSCGRLPEIAIPASVRSIGWCAFYMCANLERISVDPGNDYFCSDQGVLLDKECIKLIQYPAGRPGRYTLPNSVRSIELGAFAGSRLSHISLPFGVTAVGESTFAQCDRLSSIAIPETVTSIGARAFEHCTALKNLDIPEGVTSIGDGAFLGCTGLTDVTVGSCVTQIGKCAFARCHKLAHIRFRGDAPSLDIAPFSNSANVTVFYRRGAKNWGSKFGGRPTSVWTD